MDGTDLLVIGAGPYAYAAAACARQSGIDVHVVGHPMAFWREQMPAGMFLRSGIDWHLDAAGDHTFEAFFEDRRARRPITFFETSWSEQEWTRGCPVGIPAVGSFVSYGPRLREPVGAIHWAGTETATYWNGYMDGAISSGERAATEVEATL